MMPTPPPQVADHAEEPVHLAVAERGGRLIHDEDPCPCPQRAGDLDQLLLGHRQTVDHGIGVDGCSDAGREAPALAAA